MDFEFDEDQILFRDSLREFLQKEFAPIVDEKDKQIWTREEALDVMKKLRKMGMGFDAECVSELASDLTILGITCEESAKVWASLVPLFGMSAMPGICLNFAPDELKDKWMPRLERGEFIGCFGETEQRGGCDTSYNQTAAELEGDHYVINGSKTWITNATIEDVSLVGTDIEGSPTFLLVDKEESPYDTSLLHKIGWNAGPTGELFFDHCEVPEANEMSNFIGNALGGGILEELEVPEGVASLLTRYTPATALLTPARAGMSLMATGIAEAAYEASVKYAREREVFGKPIGKFQLIQDMLYKMYVFIETARMLGYRALDAIQKGNLDARKIATAAKAYACEGSVKATYYAIQIHGGMGLSDEMPLERYFRDARVMTVPDGTSEIMKLIVGYEILGKGFSAYV